MATTAAPNTPAPSGPIPFKDVDDGSVPEHTPKEEFGDLVEALPRRQQSILELRLYQGFWLPEHWVPGTIVFQRRFSPRPDDVVLASYPKCGTTWLKALAFAAAARTRRPRRDPKDMVVSLWHFLRRAKPDLSFAETFESACDGPVAAGPVWDHVLSYWRASVARPDRFMGRPFSPAEEAAGDVAAVVELCSFDGMKGLEVNMPGAGGGTAGRYRPMPRDAFFRKGVAGDWANHMTPEMTARLDGIVREKLQGTGLAFA
ncbi:unnamed protein product [Urochloa decumbens]|uniref:Sulfotransferase n=1 Tax=Urochloa decumbens TaxID=240449 RepID=A0ABC9G076_9POAL